MEPNHRRDTGCVRARCGSAPPLAKLRAARLGITSASDAIEIHGGNGYIETWPVARILRDAQVNTLWEGPDNILCLDVRRGIEREGADESAARADPGGRRQRATTADPTTRLVAKRADDLRRCDRRVEAARP